MSSNSRSRYLQPGQSDLISKVPRSSFSKLLEGEEVASGSKFCSNIGSKKSAECSSSVKRVIAWNSTPSQDESNRHASRDARLERRRPVSAPASSQPIRRSSLSSMFSSDCNDSSVLASSEISSSGRTLRKKKPLYKQPSKVVCVRAFVNGDRDTYGRVTASDLKQLLEECTAKLGLVSAARRLYLSDGTLIKEFKQIKKNSDIYVSCGEAFKDPFGKYKERERLGRLSTWTMNGIIFPESKTRGKTKPSLSQRMKILVEKQKRRVLVFANEDHTLGKEIVAGRFDEFLDDCTRKLDFESGARGLYDCDGNEIGNFSQVPVVDAVLQPTPNVVLGPLWVTKGGEKFSYKGPCGFVETLLKTTKERLHEARDYESQLDLRLQGSEEPISTEIMSFTTDEAVMELQQVRNKINDLESVIPRLKSRKKRLQMKKREEEMNSVNSSSFKFQNIAEIEDNSRLLGKNGIRLKVYENGKIDNEVIVYFNLHEASKGIGNDHEALLRRLLDAITSHQKVLKQGHGPAGRPVAKRIYRDNGEEVINVRELKTDDCVWLSFGENFIPPYTYALQLVMDKAKLVSLWNEKKILQREPLNDDVSGKERASLWRVIEVYPSDSNYHVIDFDTEPQHRVSYARGLQLSQIRESNTFIQYKTDVDLILYSELSVERKMSKNDTSTWPPDSQKWVVRKDGLIFSRTFPQLCLGISELKINVEYGDGIVLEGFVVKPTKRDISRPEQLWRFTPSGDICNLASPSHVLSWIANENYHLLDDHRLQNEYSANSSQLFSKSSQRNQEENVYPVFDGLYSVKDVYGGEKYYVAVLPRLPSKHPAIGSQRWALKQERLNNMGQWKYSQVPNPEWNRRALSWPVKQDGTLNEDFKWPMEGFLICNAPPVKRRETSSIGPPVRLRVLKNGENDLSRAVTVTGPDLSNMARDIKVKPVVESNKLRSPSLSSSQSGIRSLELNLFLDRCTEALQLPFAARRLFDESGAEFFNLADLQRNQLVFVSCGEAWVDFKTSHSEQQRRLIITNLASDVAKLRLYCSLRKPEDLVLSIDGSVAEGSPVCVTKCELTQEEQRQFLEDNVADDHEKHDLESDSSIEGVKANLLSAHERSHVKAEERLKTLQWPWETAITTNGELSIEEKQYGDFEHDVVYSNHRLHKKYRHHAADTQPTSDSVALPYQWLYKDGFLHVNSNTQLVVGVSQDDTEDKLVSKVVLCKKRLDESSQRWTIAQDGTIHLRSNSDMVLTVCSPSVDSQAKSAGYAECRVLVMPRKPQHGNANQLWSHAPDTGFLLAFATDVVNTEITAANKAGICTYAVTGSKGVRQIGYSSQDKPTQSFLCEACGKASRGKFRLQKLEKSQIFFCAMGEADRLGRSSCFKCLSNKVDLMTHEAEATLGMWEEQLRRLRKVTSVRSLKKEIQAAQSVPAVRIRAYKNGDGSRREPDLVIGSTIDSLLAQSTARLGLPCAARRLYTADGEHITDINQLRGGSSQGTRFSANMQPRKKGKHEKSNGDQKLVDDREDPIDMVSIANHDQAEYIEPEKHSSCPRPLPATNESSMGSGRFVTDVFVSCGEPFIPLQEVDRQYFLQRKHQNARTWVENHLETEKHVLRQMQGRRISAGLSSDALPGRPVTPSWHELSRLEEAKLENIEELTEHLKDLKTKQQQEKEKLVPPSSSSNKILTNKRLYDGAKTVRIDVYENGDSEKRCVSICGSSFLEILSICTTRLGLNSAARRMFTAAGQEVHDVSELRKGESYCVSSGENYIQPKDRQRTLERKAAWSRLNRETRGAMAYKTHERSLALTEPTYPLTRY